MNNFEKIEAYAQGWMNERDRVAFEAELKTNAALNKDFEDWQNTDRVLKRRFASASHLQEFEKELIPLTQKYFKEQQKPRARLVYFKKYMIAATAIAATFVIYFSLPAGIENYSMSPMPQAIVRGTEEFSNQGAILFNKEKYEEALPFLQKQAAAKPNDATAQFYYAVCMLKILRYKEALPLLEKLVNSTSAYQEDAAFFASLAAYKLAKKEEAEKYAMLVTSQSSYYTNAQKILKKIR